jgi:hypothetical protein
MKFGVTPSQPEDDDTPAMQPPPRRREQVAPAPIFSQLNEQAYISLELNGRRKFFRPDLPFIQNMFQLHPGEEPVGIAQAISDAAIYLEKSMPWVRLAIAPVVVIRVDDENGNPAWVETMAEVIETQSTHNNAHGHREVIVTIVLSSNQDIEGFFTAFWSMVMKAYLLEARYLYDDDLISNLAQSAHLSQAPALAAVEKTNERRLIDDFARYATGRMNTAGKIVVDNSSHGSLYVSIYEGVNWNEEGRNWIRDIAVGRNEYRKPGQYGGIFSEFDAPDVPPLPAEFLPGGELSSR